LPAIVPIATPTMNTHGSTGKIRARAPFRVKGGVSMRGWKIMTQFRKPWRDSRKR
jgi:hypothetical protein